MPPWPGLACPSQPLSEPICLPPPQPLMSRADTGRAPTHSLPTHSPFCSEDKNCRTCADPTTCDECAPSYGDVNGECKQVRQAAAAQACARPPPRHAASCGPAALQLSPTTFTTAHTARHSPMPQPPSPLPLPLPCSARTPSASPVTARPLCAPSAAATDTWPWTGSA